MGKTKRVKGGRPGGFGAGGGAQNMLARAQQIREEMLSVQAEIAETVVEGEAGAGRVKAQVNGAGALLAVKISPELVTEGDGEIIEDLVVAAVADATEKMAAITEEKMGPYASMIQGF